MASNTPKIDDLVEQIWEQCDPRKEATRLATLFNVAEECLRHHALDARHYAGEFPNCKYLNTGMTQYVQAALTKQPDEWSLAIMLLEQRCTCASSSRSARGPRSRHTSLSPHGRVPVAPMATNSLVRASSYLVIY